MPHPSMSPPKVVMRRSIQILIRQQGGDVERSIFTCQADITFGELFLDIKQKRSKQYNCTAVHVTGNKVDKSMQSTMLLSTYSYVCLCNVEVLNLRTLPMLHYISLPLSAMFLIESLPNLLHHTYSDRNKC